MYRQIPMLLLGVFLLAMWVTLAFVKKEALLSLRSSWPSPRSAAVQQVVLRPQRSASKLLRRANLSSSGLPML